MMKRHLRYVERLLKQVKRGGESTYRLLSICGLQLASGRVILNELKEGGYMRSFQEGRSVIWRTTLKGAVLLDNITKIYSALEMTE